jgi:hypothetical protein
LNWLQKVSFSDIQRVERNIRRLQTLKQTVHDLGYLAIASNSGGFLALQELLDDQLIKGRPAVHSKLKDAFIGENGQKVALDAPTKFQNLMVEAEGLIQNEIGKEIKALRKLNKELEK